MAAWLASDFPAGWRVPLRNWTNDLVAWLVDEGSGGFRAVADALTYALYQVERFLGWLPWWLIVALLALFVWHASGRRWRPAVLVVVALVLTGSFGLWDQLVTTLALMVIATTLCVLIGVPLGIAMSRSGRFKALLRPILDVMQTMPSFVYLVPVVMFFGLGNVPAIFATVAYALPPVVRLSDLGLRMVDRELIEAAASAGASERQTLLLIKLPLALPTMLAGINQTIMLALSMVVLASMVGARGLGEEVLRGLQRGDVGHGLQAGLAIVFLAVLIDRVTAGYARRFDPDAEARG